MRVTIVGAGIGGLSTAIALARPPHKHSVTVLESAPELELTEPLSVFETYRMTRTGAMRQASLVAGTVLHLPAGPEQEARDAAMRPGPSGETTTKNPYGITDPGTQR